MEILSHTKLSSLTLFFPSYNDVKSIGKIVKLASKIAPLVASKHEIIVVDDFSTDGSRELLKKLSQEIKELRLIFHDSNMGYGAALRSGFKQAKFDYLFYTDGDGQYDVSELPLLVGLISGPTNFVNGIKMDRKDPSYRIIIGNIYSFLVRWLFWVPIFDIDCDFRLIKTSLLKRLKLESDSGSICIELIKKAQLQGASFRQVSVSHHQRQYGQSQFFIPSKLIHTLMEISILWINLILKRSYAK